MSLKPLQEAGYISLIREAAKKLGYARTGPLVVAAVENGIYYARNANRILFDDYGYVTLNTQY